MTNLWGQTFEFYFKGEPVKDGETVTIPSIVNPFTKKAKCETGGLLTINSHTAVDVKFTATLNIEENTMGTSAFEICMGGGCRSFEGTYFSANYTLMSMQSLPTQYDATPQKEGVIITKFTAKSTTGETHYVYVKFTHGDISGIQTLSSDVKSSVNVYTVSGRLLRRGCALKDIPTMSPGIYLLRDDNGKAYKVILK